MGYYDAEIFIQDVDPLNKGIFEKGCMYVNNLNSKKAPLYFAPHFTQQTDKPGISMISRVIHVEAIEGKKLQKLADKKLAEGKDLSMAPTETHERLVEQWRYGLWKIGERAQKGGWQGINLLFYLDNPRQFMDPPLTKKECGWGNQIPPKANRAFDQLLKIRSDKEALCQTS